MVLGLFGSLMSSALAQSSLQITTHSFISTERCSGQFIPHELSHITEVPSGTEVRMFESNGSGVAINDLDQDGDFDILLGNHASSDTILWNDGNLEFHRSELLGGNTRTTQIIDIDGDGLLDIFLTKIRGAPNFWHNLGEGQFVRIPMIGLSKPLYATNWADVDKDGDLDLVGATYDAGLLAEFGQEFLMNQQGGVFYYENQGERFREVRLASTAQGLALLLADINQDGNPEIIVGNDFALPDQSWTWNGSQWQPILPFSAMTYSTMSYDYGDIENNGHLAIFATDMKPYETSPEALEAWKPIIESLFNEPRPASDPQIMQNVLQIPTQATFQDQATQRGISASGWSWSGKFADFDQDGYLDLYIVNGMMESTTFAHLPNHELVEENQVFRNQGDGTFLPMPEWGLGSTLSGRGLSVGDLDFDGDLDFVVNNLRGQAMLYENQLCKGASLQLELRDNSPNSYAIGSIVKLYTDHGVYQRDIRVGSGYLSGDPTRIHFGFPKETQIERVEIQWWDGEISQIPEVKTNTFITIDRN